jgi:hypothetical protein
MVACILALACAEDETGEFQVAASALYSGAESYVFRDLGTGETTCSVTWNVTTVQPILTCEDCLWAYSLKAIFVEDQGNGDCAEFRRDYDLLYGLSVVEKRDLATMMIDRGDGWEEWMPAEWDGETVTYDGRRKSVPWTDPADRATYELEYGYFGQGRLEVQ